MCVLKWVIKHINSQASLDLTHTDLGLDHNQNPTKPNPKCLDETNCGLKVVSTVKSLNSFSIHGQKIAGLTTNIPFIMSLCDHPEFQAGNVNTDFIPTHRDSLFKYDKQTEIDAEIACCSLSTILDHELQMTRNTSTGM